MTSKDLIRKYFEIGSILWEEALQCALITAEIMNDKKLITEITQLYKNDIEKTNNAFIQKYYKPKSAEQMLIFEQKTFNQNP